MRPLDGELVARAKRGDRAAFDALVGPLIDHAFRFANAMLHDREAAQDVVQEAAIRAWLRLDNLRPDTEIRPWFLGIVRNQCRSTLRGRWWSVIRLADPPPSSGRSFDDHVVAGADLHSALMKLAPEHREVLVLHYYNDLPLQEVSAIAGIPLGTVKSRINRALSALRPFFRPVEAVT